MTEEWRDIPGLEHRYRVSSLGRIWSLISSPPRELTRQFDSDGYPIVGLWNGKRQTNNRVHRLVALAFHGDKRNPLHREVAHLDGDRTNPRADNLKWVSHVENHSHRVAHGTSPVGEKHPRARLTDEAILHIRSRYATSAVIGADYGISLYTVRDIWQSKRWGHI